jgi:hypothetical protein
MDCSDFHHAFYRRRPIAVCGANSLATRLARNSARLSNPVHVETGRRTRTS